MFAVIILCVVLIFLARKVLKDEPTWQLGLVYFGLGLAIVVCILEMSGLMRR